MSSRLIVGIFDFDAVTQEGSATREFLRRAQEMDQLEPVSADLPRSFVVTVERVYLSPISAATLLRRVVGQDQNEIC